MASSLVVSLNKGKLRHLFLGALKSLRALARSLRMAWFFRQRPSAEGTRPECLETSVSSPVLTPRSASNPVVTPSSSSSTSSLTESNCSRSGLAHWAPSKGGRHSKVGSSKCISRIHCWMKNLSALVVIPHPRGEPWGVVA